MFHGHGHGRCDRHALEESGLVHQGQAFLGLVEPEPERHWESARPVRTRTREGFVSGCSWSWLRRTCELMMRNGHHEDRELKMQDV